MADSHDTLNIGSLRLEKDFPIAEVQAARAPEPAKNEAGATAARGRIDALPDYMPLPHTEQHPLAPAVPTADLITDKHILAKQHLSQPLIARPKIPSYLHPLLTAIGVFAMVLLLFKSPVILSQLNYAFNKPQATPAAAVAAPVAVPADNTITIPKISVHAPVVYEPSIQEAAVQKALENGVVHYGNTAVPGQNGNVAIFGHSSNDWWEPGNYKFVFVLLDKLAPGDQVTLDYQSHRYTYVVTGTKVVDPTDVSVLNPTSTPTLSIITCTPPGTSLKRLVVTAKQVDPNPNAATVATSNTAGQTSATLPSGSTSSGFFTTLWQTITSLFGGSQSSNTSNTQPANGAATLPASK